LGAQLKQMLGDAAFQRFREVRTDPTMLFVICVICDIIWDDLWWYDLWWFV